MQDTCKKSLLAKAALWYEAAGRTEECKMRAADLCLSKRHIVGSTLTLALTDNAEFDLQQLGPVDRDAAERALLGFANCPCPTFLAESAFDTAEFAGWKFYMYRLDFPMLGSARVVYMVQGSGPRAPDDDGGVPGRCARGRQPVAAAGHSDSPVDEFALAAAAEHLAGDHHELSRRSIASAILTLLDCTGGPALTGFHFMRSLRNAEEWNIYGLGGNVRDIECRQVDRANVARIDLFREISRLDNTGRIFRIYLHGSRSDFARVSFGLMHDGIFMRLDKVRKVFDGCRFVAMPSFCGLTAGRASDLLSPSYSSVTTANIGTALRLPAAGIVLVALPQSGSLGDAIFPAT